MEVEMRLILCACCAAGVLDGDLGVGNEEDPAAVLKDRRNDRRTNVQSERQSDCQMEPERESMMNRKKNGNKTESNEEDIDIKSLE